MSEQPKSSIESNYPPQEGTVFEDGVQLDLHQGGNVMSYGEFRQQRANRPDSNTPAPDLEVRSVVYVGDVGEVLQRIRHDSLMKKAA